MNRSALVFLETSEARRLASCYKAWRSSTDQEPEDDWRAWASYAGLSDLPYPRLTELCSPLFDNGIVDEETGELDDAAEQFIFEAARQAVYLPPEPKLLEALPGFAWGGRAPDPPKTDATGSKVEGVPFTDIEETETGLKLTFAVDPQSDEGKRIIAIHSGDAPSPAIDYLKECESLRTALARVENDRNEATFHLGQEIRLRLQHEAKLKLHGLLEEIVVLPGPNAPEAVAIDMTGHAIGCTDKKCMPHCHAPRRAIDPPEMDF